MLKIKCTKSDKENVTHTLLVGKTYTVGRKGCDISFPDDQSISRNHAEIVIEHPMANMTDSLLTPTLVITDLGSKFGTFANDGIERKSKMAMREALNLSPGDLFKFGLQWNEYKILYTPLITTPSAIKEPLLHKLKTTIMTLGGHLISEFEDNINYIVMDHLTLTVKAVCGLLSAKFIVTPGFFDDTLECVKTNKGAPNPVDYLPELLERNISSNASFLPNEERKRLFEGKIFLFVSQKHLKKMGVAVRAGGGSCKLLSEVPISNLMNDKYIIMKPSERDLFVEGPLKKIVEDYKKKKRLIQDSEIGLSAVYISLEKHCNPSHNFMDNLKSQASSSSNINYDVLAPETQQETQASDWGTTSVVPETFVAEKKRVKTEGGGAGGVTKKKRIADSLLQNNTQNKRTRSETQSLSSIFGFSDDDEMGEEEVLAPETQTQEGEEENVVYSMQLEDFVAATTSEDEEKNEQSAVASPKKNKRKLTMTPEVSPIKYQKKIKIEEFVAGVEELKIEPEFTTPTIKTKKIKILFQQDKIQPKLELIQGKAVKNFKCFQKVLPLSSPAASGVTSEIGKSVNNFSFMSYTFRPVGSMPKRKEVDEDVDEDSLVPLVIVEPHPAEPTPPTTKSKQEIIIPQEFQQEEQEEEEDLFNF